MAGMPPIACARPCQQSQERRESIRQTWMRLTLQQHANVDVRFVLGQPDGVGGAGLGTGGLRGETAFTQAHSLLLVRSMTPDAMHILAKVCFDDNSDPSTIAACRQADEHLCKLRLASAKPFAEQGASRGVTPATTHGLKPCVPAQPEARQHSDLVIVRGRDAYRNLPNKTLRALLWGMVAPQQYTHM